MDPYKVLGVPHGADQETIKKAYYKLVKQYHPDKYVDNPLKDLAEEKLKEINKAYEMLTGGSNSGSSQGSHQAGAGYGGGYNYSGNSYGSKGAYADVRRLVESGRIEEALVLLETKDKSTAEYNYLKGIIYLRKGWYGEAVRYINTAANMEPSNQEYQYARANLNNRAGGYRDVSGSYGGGMNTCDCCSNLLCADCLCEMCGGDLISCC